MVLSSSDVKKNETFSKLNMATDVMIAVGVLNWLRASPPLSSLSAIALGRYGADQAKSSLTPHNMRSSSKNCYLSWPVAICSQSPGYARGGPTALLHVWLLALSFRSN